MARRERALYQYREVPGRAVEPARCLAGRRRAVIKLSARRSRVGRWPRRPSSWLHDGRATRGNNILSMQLAVGQLVESTRSRDARRRRRTQKIERGPGPPVQGARGELRAGPGPVRAPAIYHSPGVARHIRVLSSCPGNFSGRKQAC